MSVRDSLFSVLVSDPALYALVGDKVYPDAAPQGMALPYVVFAKLSDPHQHHIAGATNLLQPMYQITGYATKRLAAERIGDAIVAVIDTRSGTVGDDLWHWASVGERRDLESPRGDGTYDIDHGDQIEVTIWH